MPKGLCILQCLCVNRYDVYWSWIRKIPRGRVATYGQIATLAGFDGHARQVGYALHNLPERSDVPWHRVVNARGEVSPRSAGDSHELQRMLLEGEGVEFSLRGCVDLARFAWRGPKRGTRNEERGTEKPETRRGRS